MTITSHHLTQDHASKLAAIGISRQDALARGWRSVEVPEDLPEGMPDYWPEALPGMLFTHVSRAGVESYQLRPDKPKAGMKYLFQPGPNSISVGLNFRKRIEAGEEITTIIPVEGTKQAGVADVYAPAGMGVIGQNGCYGYIREGRVNPEYAWFVTHYPDATWVILFDKDIATNPMVWTAARNFAKYLRSIGVKKVRFASFGAGVATDEQGRPLNDTEGLDDFLGAFADDQKSSIFASIVNAAADKLPAQPKSGDARISASVNWEGAAIETVGVDPNGEARVSRTAKFAARVAKVKEVWDDLNDPKREKVRVIYDLEVVFQPGQDTEREVMTIRGVNDAHLADVDVWLRRCGYRGVAVDRDSSVQGNRRVADAIRADLERRLNGETPPTIEFAYERTGWVLEQGMHVYLMGGGSIGAEGVRATPSAQMPYPYSEMAFGIPDSDYEDELAARSAFGFIRGLLPEGAPHASALPALATLGSWAVTFAGLVHGMPVESGHSVFLWAPPGSGKSVFVEVKAMALSPNGSAHIGGQATGNAIGDVGRRVHDAPVEVDDIGRERASRGKEEDAEEGIDTLIRRSYSGGAGSRTRMVRDENGEYYTPAPLKNWSTAGIAGERIPNGGSDSVLGRTYGCQFMQMDKEALTDSRVSAGLNFLFGAYIQWVATQRNMRPASGPDSMLGQFKTRLDEVQAEVMEKADLGGRSEKWRRARVAATIIVGLEMLFAFGNGRWAGFFEDAPFSVEEAREILIRGAEAWRIQNGEQRDGGESNVLEKLRGIAASGTKFLVVSETVDGLNASQSVLGMTDIIETEEGTRDILWLNQSAALDALGWTDSKKKDTQYQADLRNALANVCIKVNGSVTTPRTFVRGAKSKSRAYAIPMEVWDPLD